jgi:hypothetical protein
MFLSLIPDLSTPSNYCSYRTRITREPSHSSFPIDGIAFDAVSSLDGAIDYRLRTGTTIFVVHQFYPFTHEPLAYRPLLGKGLADRIQLLVAQDMAAQFPQHSLIERADTPWRECQLQRLGIEQQVPYLLPQYQAHLERILATR